MIRLARITLYPIKSLDGVDVAEAVVLPSGSLARDRQFAMVDADGRILNAKRSAAVHAIRAVFDPLCQHVQLKRSGSEAGKAIFDLTGNRTPIEAWLSHALGMPIQLIEEPDRGFPDDTNSPGPTILSMPTLREVASWFPGLSPDSMRRRLRANLELDAPAAFWEDRLFTEPGQTVPFRVGNVRLEGVNPCARCPVPSRDPDDGTPLPGFARHFADRRQATLPPWVNPARFDQYYRLAVNTRLAKASGSLIRVGDTIEVEAI